MLMMYFKVMVYFKLDKTTGIIYPDGASFFQFFSDITGHNLATFNGKNTHHGLSTIVIVNGKFLNCSIQQQEFVKIN